MRCHNGPRSPIVAASENTVFLFSCNTASDFSLGWVVARQTSPFTGILTVKIAFQNLAFLSAALFSMSAVSGSAVAQSSSSGCESGHCPTVVYRNSHYGHRSPTYGDGFRPYGYDYRYGTAELLRASATANVLNANARNQNAYTARLEMENSVQFLTTRLERKQINKQTRFGHLRARGEQVRHAKLGEDVLVGRPAPRGPVDPATGRVAWPLLLRSTYYAKARGPIDLVFHQRSLAGSINPDYFLPMRDWIERIECELKANVAYYEITDYLEAKDFLRSLVEEARIDLVPSDPQTQLASR